MIQDNTLLISSVFHAHRSKPAKRNLNKRSIALLLFQIGFGAMVAFGATMELALAFNLIELPDVVKATYANWHRPQFIQIWLVASNMLVVPIGLTLSATAVMYLLWRRGALVSRYLSSGLLGMMLIGQFLMVPVVYPNMPKHVMFASVMGAIGALSFCALLWRFWISQVQHSAKSSKIP